MFQLHCYANLMIKCLNYNLSVGSTKNITGWSRAAMHDHQKSPDHKTLIPLEKSILKGFWNFAPFFHQKLVGCGLRWVLRFSCCTWLNRLLIWLYIALQFLMTESCRRISSQWARTHWSLSFSLACNVKESLEQRFECQVPKRITAIFYPKVRISVIW